MNNMEREQYVNEMAPCYGQYLNFHFIYKETVIQIKWV